MTGATLSVNGLCAGYGSMQVVQGIDLMVQPSEVVGILGRNGAGKTTAVRAIAGLRHGKTSGEVRFGDKVITSLDSVGILRTGLAFVPEGHRVFPNLTVLENLRMGSFLRRRGPSAEIEASMGEVLILFPPLRQFMSKLAGQLSGGEQQMVAIGQALMAKPKLLILDEPTSALAPRVGDAIYDALARLGSEGLGVLVVEQDIDRALRNCDRCYVMEDGEIRLTGAAAQLSVGTRVQEIVLGTARSRA